jgi:molybdenum-dependent DNA-binding transcriptional regulator ModE
MRRSDRHAHHPDHHVFEGGSLGRPHPSSSEAVMDRLTTIATFVKVAQAGGFSVAARALNMSPGHVTKQVQWLERLLRVRLLNRTTRSVRLTEAGTAYYERCLRVLAELKDADQIAQGLQSVPSGTLRLNASTMMLHLIDPVIDQFSRLHPNARVEMVATDCCASRPSSFRTWTQVSSPWTRGCALSFCWSAS